MRGLYLRVPTTGPVVFAVVSRDPYGKQVWTTIGNADTYKIEEAPRAGAQCPQAREGWTACY